MSIPLPFVVQPKQQPVTIRLGTEDTGVLEIKRFGYLTTGEKAAFQKVETNKEGQNKLRAVTDKIHKDLGIPHTEILSAIAEIGTDKEPPEYLNAYTSDLLEMLQAFEADTVHLALVKATVLLISRVDSDISFNTVAGLHPDLVQNLASLYDAEESKSLEALPGEFVALAKEESEATNVQKEATKQVKGGKARAQAQP